MSSKTPPVVPGYDVLDPLGDGATAGVWRARRQADGLTVALKVVRPAGGDVGAALAEAGLLARVRHLHVVHLYDVLPVPDPRSGRPDAVVLVTQLAGGGSLGQILARRGMLSPGEVVTALQPVAGALADLHHLGVVHGDLSTGNILFLADGMPLLADLGTARVAGEPGLTGLGTGGAQGLVAPEVLEGFPATRESDVYQVGALAWLCLVGEPPGPGFDRPAFAEAAPALPRPVVELVTRCMAPEPEDRPDAEEVAVALLAVATPEPLEVAPDADPAHGLTERLRQVAQEDASEAGPETAGVWRRVRRRISGAKGGGGSHRSEKGRGTPAPQGWLAAAGLFLLSTLVGAVVVAVLWPPARAIVGWGGPPASPVDAATAGPATAPAPTTAGPATAPVPSREAPASETSETSGADAVVQTQEPDDDPDGEEATDGGRALAAEEAATTDELVAQVQTLVDGRARAWEATDPDLLTEVVAAGSPAEDAERTELLRAQEAGISYPRVGFRVEDLVVTDRGEDRLRVEATLTREPLEARDDSGWLVRTPAQRESVALDLVREDGRWLMWSWEVAATDR